MINKFHYYWQYSRDIEEMLLEDIDAEIKTLNSLVSSDIVSPSAEDTIKSSVGTLISNITEEITESF